MPITRKTESGKVLTFNQIGKELPTPTEKQLDKWLDIPTPPNATEDEQLILTMLDQRLSAAKEKRLKRFDVFNSSYMQYRSVNYYTKMYGGFPSYWNEWGANAFIPRTFEVVEAARAQLKSKEADFSVEPVGAKNSQYADNLGTMLHSEWRRSESQSEAVEALDDSILFGRGILRNDLIKDIQTENKLSWEATTLESGKTVNKVKFTPTSVVKYYGVASRRVDPYDFFPDPSVEATKVNSRLNRGKALQYCFVRTIADVEEVRDYFKTLYEMGEYGVTDKYQYLKPGGDLNDYKYIRSYIDDLYQVRQDVRYPSTILNVITNPSSKITTQESGYTSGKIEYWEYFERDRHIIFAQGLILLDEPNKYPHKELPFSGMVLVDTKTFDGVGYPEIMRWLQIIENTLYDQGLSNIVMNVHKMFAVNSRFLEDEGELVARPFGIIHLKNNPGVSVKDAIQPIEFSPLFQDFFNFLSLNKSNITTLTGQSEFSTGGITKESKIERATVANRIVQGGILRVNEIARHFEQDLIQPALEQLGQIMQFYYAVPLTDEKEDGLDVEKLTANGTQFFRFLPIKKENLTKEIASKYSGSEFGYRGAITVDDIQGSFRVVVKGGSTISSEPEDDAILKIKWADFASKIIDPATGKVAYDMVKIADEVAKDVYKVSNVNDFKLKKPEVAPVTEETTPPAEGTTPPEVTTPQV